MQKPKLVKANQSKFKLTVLKSESCYNNQYNFFNYDGILCQIAR